MRGAAAAVAALGVAFPAGGSSRPPIQPIPISPPPLGAGRAHVTPATAGARPVRLDLEMSFELQCGRPGGGPAFVSLPAASTVPDAIPRAAVLVDGHPPASVTVSGRVVRLGLQRPNGIICDVIGPGAVTVVFTRAAGLGNPKRPGGYPVTMRLGLRTVAATFAVS